MRLCLKPIKSQMQNGKIWKNKKKTKIVNIVLEKLQKIENEKEKEEKKCKKKDITKNLKKNSNTKRISWETHQCACLCLTLRTYAQILCLLFYTKH